MHVLINNAVFYLLPGLTILYVVPARTTTGGTFRAYVLHTTGIASSAAVRTNYTIRYYVPVYHHPGREKRLHLIFVQQCFESVNQVWPKIYLERVFVWIHRRNVSGMKCQVR